MVNRRSFLKSLAVFASVSVAAPKLLYGKSVECIRYVNVRFFGAVGDGVTDDTEAFQKVMDAAKFTGANVYVPPGTYFFGEQTCQKAKVTDQAVE